MFTQLLESRPPRRRTPAGFAASLALHGILVAGAVVATARAPHAAAAVPPVHALIYVPTPPPPKAPAPAAPDAPPLISVVPVPSVIDVPVDVPVGLPPITPLRRIINTDDPIFLRVGVPTSAGTPGSVPATPTGAYSAEQVEVLVTIDPRSPLPRFPQMLKNAGVEGTARLQFVVDTLGRVELGSVQVVSTTHPLFAEAVQSVLPRMQFTPARVGDRRVRQLVEFPIQFTIAK